MNAGFPKNTYVRVGDEIIIVTLIWLKCDAADTSFDCELVVDEAVFVVSQPREWQSKCVTIDSFMKSKNFRQLLEKNTRKKAY